MKHNKRVTWILIAMFLLTQIIGLGVVSIYQIGLTLPYGMARHNKLTNLRP
jgi:hypothetical protein